MAKFITLVCLCLFPNFYNYSQAGKIPANLPHVELSDYRFGLGDPYVIFYEREGFRGQVYFHRMLLSPQCTNLPEDKQHWASSIDLQRRCVTLCDQLDCKGHCARIFPDPNPRITGALKLQKFGLNDKVASVKFCY